MRVNGSTAGTDLAFAHASAALRASSRLSYSTKAVPFSFCVFLSFTSLHQCPSLSKFQLSAS